MEFAGPRNIDSFNPSDLEMIAFLTDLVNEGLSYSAVNTAKAAIINFMACKNNKIKESVYLSRFMKGVAEKRPSQYKYRAIWDPDQVLDYLRSLPDNDQLSLSILTKKLAMLAALVTGHRSQTLHLLNTNNIKVTDKCACFTITKALKNKKASAPPLVIHFPKFEEDPRVCIWRCLQAYSTKTQFLRANSGGALFLTTMKPYNPAARDTIRNWIKWIMSKSGINVKEYKAHSVRAASTSKASQSLSIQSIMKAAGWARSSTFANHYRRPIQGHQDFADAVLRPTTISHV